VFRERSRGATTDAGLPGSGCSSQDWPSRGSSIFLAPLPSRSSMPPDVNDSMPLKPLNQPACHPAAGFFEIRTTCPSREVAEALAARLVRARLAACVQVDGPIRSTYAWQGAVETADEWRCICKTTAARAAACADAITAGHPYENPEIVMAPIEASEAYGAWVRESVSDPAGGGG